MDPNAAWNEFLESTARQDRRAAVERLLDLYEWIKRGGFPPDALHGNIGATPAEIIEGFLQLIRRGT